ncbi:hypothetical protein Godav_025478 [Gossypium davidsonii]|uniref:Uncharacterized protein n=1 Tax=Gossypium davidsonii TaxID=34287 RepID=A0A7J8TD41_GOSDV|nr:hypothetical protein [Gossypium davidsonii]
MIECWQCNVIRWLNLYSSMYNLVA